MTCSVKWAEQNGIFHTQKLHKLDSVSQKTQFDHWKAIQVFCDHSLASFEVELCHMIHCASPRNQMISKEDLNANVTCSPSSNV